MAGSRGSRLVLTPHKEGPIVWMDLQAAPTATRQQNGAMATDIAAPIEQRLAVMAAGIRRLIPAAEVRLFGSRARGQAGPDSDVDLLITAPDQWCRDHDRFMATSQLWRRLARHHLPIDLLLYSRSEVAERVHLESSVTRQAYSNGITLHGQP